MTIFLCGFMGCGKSTIGKRLAAGLHVPFTDMDDYIEQQAGMTIPEIFEKFGEPHFRDLETQAVRELASREGVIACGGGAMLREENARIAAENGRVIYLDVPFRVCYRRISDTDRPIVRRSTPEELEALYNTRKPVYKAHSTDTVQAAAAPDAVAGAISELIGEQA